MILALFRLLALMAWVMAHVGGVFIRWAWSWIAIPVVPSWRFVVRCVKRVGRAIYHRWCRRQFEKSIPPLGRPSLSAEKLMRPQSPYLGKKDSWYAGMLGRYGDGRSRLFDELGFYATRARGVLTSSYQMIPLWPILHGRRWPSGGPLFGVDHRTREVLLLGAHEVHSASAPTNNNGVIGDQETGKSGHVKRMAMRRVKAGGKVFWFDTKSNLAPNEEGVLVQEGEAAAIARKLKGTHLRFRRFGGLVLNPLDPRIIRDQTASRSVGAEKGGRHTVIGQDSLLVALYQELREDEDSNGRKKIVSSKERYALRAALDYAHRVVGSVRAPIIADVVRALVTPNFPAAKRVRVSTDELLSWGLDAALTLDRLVTGDLSGLFNGQTSEEIRFDADFIDADLTELDTTNEAVTLVMAVLTAFLRNVWLEVDGKNKMIVVDEGWFLLSKPSIATFFLRLYKLPRSLALHNVAIFHRLFDFENLSRDSRALLHEIRWWSVFHLIGLSAEVFGAERRLSRRAIHTIERLGMDEAVVMLGDHAPRKVYFPTSPEEWDLTNTRRAMEGQREGDVVGSVAA